MRGACYHTPRAPAITRLEWAGVGSRGGGGQVRASAATDARGQAGMDPSLSASPPPYVHGLSLSIVCVCVCGAWRTRHMLSCACVGVFDWNRHTRRRRHGLSCSLVCQCVSVCLCLRERAEVDRKKAAWRTQHGLVITCCHHLSTRCSHLCLT